MQPSAAPPPPDAAGATQLAQAQRELQRLSYAISHDLRAPVRAIAGFSQALREHAAGMLDSTALHLLGRVEQGTQQLSNMIDGLLQLSRISQAELKPDNVDLSLMCTTLVAALQLHYPAHRPQVHIAAGMQAYCDPQWMRVALHALLDNAWKFTCDRAPARIDISLTHAPGLATLCVRDNGIGFDPKYADRLFVPFQHLQGRAELNGLGIGLASVQRIIDRHGGRVWMESEPQQFAACYCALPQNTIPAT